MTDTIRPTLERVPEASARFPEELLSKLREIVPETFTEQKLDLDKLRILVGEAVESRPERYEFNWAGKRDAMAMLQAPTRATLIPDRLASINFDDARHVFIEGENLETLKVLSRSYSGRVKLIYIDPPYNTGNDYIYPDDFADPLDHYLRLTGQKSGTGDYLTSQPERSGRFHSGWLSMMYPRLSRARQLLREDGFIAVSIDNNELANLKRLLDDIFGEENLISILVWEKTRKNDARFVSNGHDYIVVYARNEQHLRERGIYLREEKPGAREIQGEYLRLRDIHGRDDAAVQAGLREFYKGLPPGHPAKKHSRYGNVDARGVWRDDNMSWPGGGGPTYDVHHPVTKQVCAVPEGGWRYSTPEKMQEMIAQGVVVFRGDHTEPPIRKTYLVRSSAPSENGDAEEEEDSADVGIQVMGSYFYRSALRASRMLLDLFKGKVFENPKDHEVLARLIRYFSGPSDIVLDFFAGSGSTTHAVMKVNYEDGSDRKSISIQLPEPTPANSVAAKQGFKTISRLALERIRRAQSSLQHQNLRVFLLAASNIRRWTGVQEKTKENYTAQLEAFSDSLVSGWKPENVAWEVALREGFSLTAKTQKLSTPTTATYWRVTDADQGRSFTICLDDSLSLGDVIELGLGKEDILVCRDAALDDTLAANLALQCRLKVI